MSGGEIDEIKQRTDIVDLVGQYVNLKKAGRNFKAVCPFHQEKTASLMVSSEKQIWRCFGCGKGGSIFDFIMEAESLEFGDALRLLAGKAGVTLQPRTSAEHRTRDDKSRLLAANDYLSRLAAKILTEHPAGEPGRQYLANRKVKPEIIKQFRLGFLPIGFKASDQLRRQGFTTSEINKLGSPDRFIGRLLFPIFDVIDNVVGFTGRVIGEGEPKYLNSPESPVFNKSRLLYGLNLAKGTIKNRNYLILTEGQMDVIALHQAGQTNAVASSGTAVTAGQLTTLAKYTTNFLLAFDADTAGIATTVKVIEQLLSLDLSAKVLLVAPCKDVGELLEVADSEYPRRAKEAKEGIDWLIDQAAASVGDLKFIDHKKEVLRAVLPAISQIQDEARLDWSLARLSVLLGLKPPTIIAALNKINRTPNINRTTTPGAPGAASPPSAQEQFLALIINFPAAAPKNWPRLDWETEDSQTIAEAIEKCYRGKTLTAGATGLLDQLRTSLPSSLIARMEHSVLAISREFLELTDDQATDLIAEKLSQIKTLDYERQKTELATSIRQAQESGQTESIKRLMGELNRLTKKQE
ncbi:MAG: DNA primase [Patescibacteria group bacterium]